MSSFSMTQQRRRHPAKPRALRAADHRAVPTAKAPGACACGGGCPRCEQKQPLQAHLSVSQPSDRYEQEAERTADQVLAGHSAPTLRAPVQIQRLTSDHGEHAPAVPESVERTLAGSGRPLEPAVRNDMEQRFGHSFADVQLHLGGQAQQSARDVGAEAYAVGRHLVFAADQYAPHTPAGQHLLAHELTHVLQQTGATGAPQTVARYRAKNNPDTIAFEKDEELSDSDTQPWIEHIQVNFTSTAPDTGHQAEAKERGDKQKPRLPKGTLKATYSSNSKKKPAPVSIPVAGGSTMSGIGLTDKVDKLAVTRLEGSGYTDSKAILAGHLTDPVASEGKGARYSKSGEGTMNYAIFFKGIQAIHHGDLNTGSHACIHVQDGKKLRKLNHHTWAGHTTVSVTYSDSVLVNLCCTRMRNGHPNWDGDPCDGGVVCPPPPRKP